MFDIPVIIKERPSAFSVLSSLTKLEDLIVERSCINAKTAVKLQNKITTIKNNINSMVQKNEARYLFASLIPGMSKIINKKFEKWAVEIDYAVKMASITDGKISDSIAMSIYSILESVHKKTL